MFEADIYFFIASQFMTSITSTERTSFTNKKELLVFKKAYEILYFY